MESYDIKYVPVDKVVYARDLNDAFKKGYFSSSISRYDLEDRVTKYNETIRSHSSSTHRGLYDRNRFIVGIGFHITIPKFTICRFIPELHKKINYTDQFGNRTGSEVVNMDKADGYVFMRGWPLIVKDIMRKGYSFDEKDLF